MKEITIQNLIVRRDAVVAFRLPKAVKEAFNDYAIRQNTTITDLCEKLVLRELKREGIEISATVKLL